jgi:hypothetical protein
MTQRPLAAAGLRLACSGPARRLRRRRRAGQPAHTSATHPAPAGRSCPSCTSSVASTRCSSRRCPSASMASPPPTPARPVAATTTPAAPAVRCACWAAPLAVDATRRGRRGAGQRHVQELLLIARGKRGRQSRPEPPAEQAAGAQHAARRRPDLRDVPTTLRPSASATGSTAPCPPGRTSSAARPTPCSPLRTRPRVPATPIDRHPDAAPAHRLPFIVARRLLAAARRLRWPWPLRRRLPRRHPRRPRARATRTERLQVAEAFLELHTGPGRGYPVFFVVERQRWVMVELRHTDWYRVRAEGGRWAGCRASRSRTRSPPPARARPFATCCWTTFWAAGWRWAPPCGPLQGRAAAQAVAELPPGRHPGRGGEHGPGAGRVFRHRVVEPEPDQRALVGPALVALPVRGRGPVPQHPQQQPGGRRARQRAAGPRHAGPALAPHAALHGAAGWSLYTAFVADQRSTEYRAFSAGLAFFF